ncbi:zinc ribbon domain-containing protein [Bradyrhizobium sp. BRP22]|uniref:zinc ribbon domain-containing protein n=1 Tax=Bradyrhizobium sp. BRP22 TaxID=2793821 RepID=UPI001CD8128F|nr:zinc ribbon domain-containing protein [Bradyrhizobium sp. BRP22]
MLDTRLEGDSYRRVEMITGERRRRLWTGEEKARIVAEMQACTIRSTLTPMRLAGSLRKHGSWTVAPARSAGSKSRVRNGMFSCDNHPGHIGWQKYEDNQTVLLENAHMKKNCARKSARGGRALLTGLMRWGRCGRMMRVVYGEANGNTYRYQCRGDDAHVGAGLCIGIGGVRVDRALALQILEAVSD